MTQSTGKSKATDGALDAAALTVARDAIRNKCLEYFEKTWDYTVSEMFAAAAIRAYLAALPPPTMNAAIDRIQKMASDLRFHGEYRRGLAVALSEIRPALAALPPPTGEPVAYAYVVDGECEEIGWGAPPIDDPATIWLYAKEKSLALKEQLLSCVCLLETMAEWAAEEGHEVEHVMMSVMAKNGRGVLDAA